MPDNQNSSEWFSEADVRAAMEAFASGGGDFRSSITRALRAAKPAPAMPNGVEGLVDDLATALVMYNQSRTTMQSLAGAVGDFLKDYHAIRAADNRDAAGVWIREHLPESLHSMTTVEVMQLLLDGGIAAEQDLIHAEDTPAAAPAGEAVAFVPVHPRLGPLWNDTYASGDTEAAERRSPHYPRQPLYTHPPAAEVREVGKFQLGDRVTKTKGSKWTGRVVGTYSTALTAEGYAVESETEVGSVQIYPAAALRAIAELPSSDVEAQTNGHEDAYRAVEALAKAAPEAKPEAAGGEVDA